MVRRSHTSLHDLNRRKLRELAGERYFARGEAYFEEGRVRALLERQDKHRLIELLLEAALESESLRERLLLETARTKPVRIKLATYRRALRHAIRTGDYVTYSATGSYTRGLRRAALSLAALLADGHAAEVVELAEYALAQLEESLGYVDDSQGRVGSVAIELQELQ